MVEKILNLTLFEKTALWFSKILNPFRKIICVLAAILTLSFYITGSPAFLYIVDTQLFCMAAATIALIASAYYIIMLLIQNDNELIMPALARMATVLIFAILSRLQSPVCIGISAGLIITSFLDDFILNFITTKIVLGIMREAEALQAADEEEQEEDENY